jgi:hypothetical protein
MVLTWLWHQNASPYDIELGGKHDGLYVVFHFAPHSLWTIWGMLSLEDYVQAHLWVISGIGGSCLATDFR